MVQAPEISVTRCYSESNCGGSYYDVFDALSGRSDNTIGGESDKGGLHPLKLPPSVLRYLKTMEMYKNNGDV